MTLGLECSPVVQEVGPPNVRVKLSPDRNLKELVTSRRGGGAVVVQAEVPNSS
jgi:hypothetical protein